jgi:hypothetical protein
MRGEREWWSDERLGRAAGGWLNGVCYKRRRSSVGHGRRALPFILLFTSWLVVYLIFPYVVADGQPIIPSVLDQGDEIMQWCHSVSEQSEKRSV